MENKQEVPPQEAPAQSSGLTSILGKIVGEKEHDFVDLAKTRTIEHKFVGAYDEGFPVSCKIRRWPYGASMILLPRTVGVIGQILDSFMTLSSNKKRTLDAELDGITVDDMFTTLASKATTLQYQEIMTTVGSIIQETLNLVDKQSIKVSELEIVDIIAISKIILSQNLGVVLKNLMAAPTSAEPTAKPATEEKS